MKLFLNEKKKSVSGWELAHQVSEGWKFKMVLLEPLENWGINTEGAIDYSLWQQ